jgi:hypothetical protein
VVRYGGGGEERGIRDGTKTIELNLTGIGFGIDLRDQL